MRAAGKGIWGICIGIALLTSTSEGRAASPKSATVTIDLAFLDRLDRAKPKEVYQLWDRPGCAPELLYLVQIGNKHAIRTARKILPRLYMADVVPREEDWLALKLYDQVELKGLEKLSPTEQRVVIRAYDRLLPCDWETDKKAFLTAHPIPRK